MAITGRAIRTGMSALENKPSDDLILDQIALLYLSRAVKDRNHREQWLKQADIFADRSVAINPVINVERYEAAAIFESSGDLTNGDKCPLYHRSLTLLAEWSSTLTAENLRVGETSVPAAPIRKEMEGVKSRIEAKQTRAGCQ